MSKKTILRVQPIYTILIWFIAFCCFVFFLFLPYIFKWDSSDIYGIIFYCVIGICALVSLMILVYYIQFAYVDSEGIIIRGLFYQIIKLRWKDIDNIVCQKIITYDNRTNIYLNWIIIKLHDAEYIQGRAGRNRRKKSPWCIIATKKNIAKINQYFQIADEN